MKQAVILAGGKGSRLKERLGGLPKPLVDMSGVPLLERHIDLLKRYGFSRVLLLVNHGAHHIVDFCRSHDDWNLEIKCIDDGEPRGTAGATLAVFDELEEEFLLLYGDVMLEVDLARFESFHRQSSAAAATVFVHPNDHPQDSDLVEVDAFGRVTAFHPYPHVRSRYYANLVSAGLYWLRKSALRPWRNSSVPLDFGKDVLPAMLAHGLQICAYNSPEYVKDIGTPARLDKVRADFDSGRIARASLAYPQAAVFLDRDGTINQEVDHLRDAADFKLLPGVAEGIKRLNAYGYRCCIVSNQPVVARGECSEDDLRRVHDKMETLLGEEGAFVDRIYYCPHHPHAGFPGERADLKVDCDCRKPKTGMIDRALRELNIARERSWMVGDSSVDIETGKRAGLKCVLVETGYAGLDHRAWAVPHTTVPDLCAAVTFILESYPRLLSYCSRISDAVCAGGIVLIGGQARSGKSTFAAVLRDALRARNLNAVILSTDRWLRDQATREPGVLGRHDMKELQNLVSKVSSPMTRPGSLVLAGYEKLKRARIDSVETVTMTPQDVILIEGTVALALEPLPGTNALRFHVEIDEELREIRMLNEYRLRGMREEDARGVYRARRADEVPVLEALAAGALKVDLSMIYSSQGAGDKQALFHE